MDVRNRHVIPRLSLKHVDVLASAPPMVRPPLVDPRCLSIGIVHLGAGAFHRAHQALYTEEAIAISGETGWGILAVTGRSDRVLHDLGPQDGLYGILERRADDTRLSVVGAIRAVASPTTSSLQIARVIAKPTTRIITMTVTEKGYAGAAHGTVDLTLPTIEHDIRVILDELAGRSTDAPSRTAPGLLLRGLFHRFSTTASPITVLSCDNLGDNGAVTRLMLHSLLSEAHEEAARRDLAGAGDRVARLQEWIASSVRFPSTMVDRIVPATSREDREIAERLVGMRDDALVVAEPFRQWVIEDDFAGPRPAWEAVGVTMTTCVAPYERAKLRILNAVHSVLAYLGALRGYATIRDAVADPLLVSAVTRMVDADIIPTLVAPPGMELARYRDSVLKRFANPALAHTTQQIAMDGSQKIPQRLLETAADRVRSGDIPRELAFGVAAWIVFIASTSDRDGPALQDPLAGELQRAIGTSASLRGDPWSAVDRLVRNAVIFPEALRASAPFREAVAERIPDVMALRAEPSDPSWTASRGRSQSKGEQGQ